MSNLLMLSGDTALARGERGPFYNTLSEFAKYWDRIDVITPPTNAGKQSHYFGNVTVHPSPQRTLITQPAFIIERGRALAAAQPYQLIVSHDYGFYLNGLGARQLSQIIKVPYVSELHHIEGYPRAANLRERIQPWLARHYVAQTKSKALAFRIVNKAELKPLLLSWGVPEAKLLLLYSLYLDFNIFQPARIEPEYEAIWCGRLTANKNPMLFLESLARVQPKTERLSVLMIGRGPLAPTLKSKAQELNLKVKFIDWVEDQNELADLYRRSRCLVCTSYSEGGPRVVAEALACGVPVVTTRVGLAHELVRDGENGFQTDWSSVDIANRVVQIINDESLHKHLSQNAPMVVQRFEKSQVIQKYAQGYHQLIS